MQSTNMRWGTLWVWRNEPPWTNVTDSTSRQLQQFQKYLWRQQLGKRESACIPMNLSYIRNISSHNNDNWYFSKETVWSSQLQIFTIARSQIDGFEKRTYNLSVQYRPDIEKLKNILEFLWRKKGKKKDQKTL